MTQVVMVAVILLSPLPCTYSRKAIYWLASHLVFLQSCMIRKAAEMYLQLFAFEILDSSAIIYSQGHN